jgi:hypothetical protein
LELFHCGPGTEIVLEKACREMPPDFSLVETELSEGGEHVLLSSLGFPLQEVTSTQGNSDSTAGGNKTKVVSGQGFIAEPPWERFLWK